MKLKRTKMTFEVSLSLFAGLILVAAAAYLLLWPEMRLYERHSRKQVGEAQVQGRLQQQYDRLFEEKKALEETDAVVQERLESAADAAQLRHWIARYLPNPSVTPDEKEGPNVFIVRTTLSSPARLYDMIEAAAEAPWILQWRLPVTMQKQQGGIKTVLHLRVWHLPKQTTPEP